MREIKFRGKRLDNGEWVYGWYFIHLNKTYILPFEASQSEHTYFFDYMVRVNPETVCQYTGLKDKNGKEIYEGDILLVDGCPLEVKWAETLGAWIAENGWDDYLHSVNEKYEIIGNIYETPELLEVSE